MEKKNLFPICAIMMIALVSIGFVSCSDDDDDGNPIVGSWSCTNHYYGGTDTYVFKSDNTFTWSCTGEWWDANSGRYSYNPENGLLIITRKEGTYVYIVISLSKSSFTIMDEDESVYTYYRI